jgi:hypothetical protein
VGDGVGKDRSAKISSVFQTLLSLISDHAVGMESNTYDLLVGLIAVFRDFNGV